MDNEKRMAGDYEIIHALHIGDREIVVGENPSSDAEYRYMCALCESNLFFDRYTDAIVSNDYPEIIGIFGQRINQQAEKTRAELHIPEGVGISDAAMTAKDCKPISSADNLHNKVVVIRPEVLRREYQRATHQIMLCTGGFGASPNSRGSACHCVSLYTGKGSRFERSDILGILEGEQMPKWARNALEQRLKRQHMESEKAQSR